MKQDTEKMILVTGNTYPVKDKLRALGARWDAESRGWLVPASKHGQATSIVASAGPKAARTNTGFRSSGGGRRSRLDDACEACGRNRYTCGHCIGW